MASQAQSDVQVERQTRRLNALAWFAGLLLAIAAAWTLRATMMVTLPVAVALFVALAVWPVCAWVQRRVPPRLRWLGYIVAMLVVTGFLAFFVAGLMLAAQQIAGRVPTDPGQLRGLQQQIADAIARSGLGGLLGAEQLSAQLERIVRTVGAYAGGLLRNLVALVTGLVLVFFLVLLMLIEAPVWRAKLACLSRDPERRRSWDEAVAAIGQRFRQYFLTRLLLGAITGALYAGWLSLFGVDLLIVWGLLAFLLNFVPTVGSLIAGILPVIYVFLTRDPGTALLAGAGLLAIEQVMGNYVDPRITGKRLALSSLVVLVALLLWYWIWGTVGALMAVPMTVLLLIVFAHTTALRPVALLLSDERDMRGLDEHSRPTP